MIEEFMGVMADVTRVVAVERGVWDNDQQDYLAILVFDGGARVLVGGHIKDAVPLLNGLCAGYRSRAKAAA